MIITRPACYFEINSVPSCTPAWTMINPMELAKPARRRGTEPTVIPGAAGARANPLRAAATERVISGKVFGRQAPDGSLHTNEITGLAANLDTLTTAWVDIPGTSDSTRACTLHLPDTTTISGDIQVLDFDWDYAEMPIAANVLLRLLLPAGALA